MSAGDPSKLKSEKPYLIYPIGGIDDDPEELIAFYGLSPRAVAAAGHSKQRAHVTIEFFKLDDVAGRKDLFIARARAIVAMHPQLVNLNDADPAKQAIAKALVDGFTSAKAEHANCARSFRRVFETSPADAASLFQAAATYIATNS